LQGIRVLESAPQVTDSVPVSPPACRSWSGCRLHENFPILQRLASSGSRQRWWSRRPASSEPWHLLHNLPDGAAIRRTTLSDLLLSPWRRLRRSVSQTFWSRLGQESCQASNLMPA